MEKNKAMFLDKIEELADVANDIIDAYRNDELKRPEFILIDLCYKVLYLEALYSYKDVPDESPKPPKKAEPKGAIQQIKAMLGKPAPSAVETPAPAKVKESQTKSAVKKPEKLSNQKYITKDWGDYFDSPFIEIYGRENKGYTFYSTLTKNNEQMDVSFAPATTFEELKLQYDTFMPEYFEIQDRNGYAKLYIKTISSCDGKPVENKKY